MENLASNTTHSDISFHWVDGPKVRGTLQIFNLCLSTLIICVWSALHFDIPLTRQSPSRRFFFRIFWMLFALLGPEFLLFSAIRQRLAASTLAKGAIDHLPSQLPSQPGLLTRVYKYFCLREKLRDNELDNLVQQAPRRKYPFGFVHAFYAAMGGFIFDISSDGEGRDAPTTETFLYIMQNFPDIIPDLSEESIIDRGESSGLSKAILIAQVGWFCANCASRLVDKLPLSLLEVSTAAHGFCTLVTYFVWWSKPHNVAESTPMHGPKAREVYALLKCTGSEYNEALGIAMKERRDDTSTANAPTSETRNRELDRINLAAHALKHLLPDLPARPREVFLDHAFVSSPGHLLLGNTHNLTTVSALFLIPSLYGSLHFLGWNGAFPSSNEHLFWGISTAMITSSGCIFALLFVLGNTIELNGVQNFCAVMIPLVTVLHLLASGFLVVESVRQLFFLPPAAYEVSSWSNFWPHFS